MPFDGCFVSSLPADDPSELPDTIGVLCDGGLETELAHCPELHGESTLGDNLVFACADGLRRITLDEEGWAATEIPYPADVDEKDLFGASIPRAWGFQGADEVPHLIAWAGASHILIYDDEEGAGRIRPLELPSPVEIYGLAVVPRSASALVLTTDGILHRIDLEDAQVTDEIVLVDPFDPDLTFVTPHHWVVAGSDRASSSIPAPRGSSRSISARPSPRGAPSTWPSPWLRWRWRAQHRERIPRADGHRRRHRLPSCPREEEAAPVHPDSVKPMPLRIPDYYGTGLVNLVAEIELRLSGSAAMPGLAEPTLIPDAEGYVLAVFDGLGVHQLGIGEASPLAASLAAVLTAGFPTTTTTSLATIASGQPPTAHGVIGHLLHLPGVADVVNVLKWMTPEGRPVRHDYASMLPSPNLWERLSNAGHEPITVQPGAFLDSPLSAMLYRGCRFEAIWSVEELVAATVELAAPGRLVVPYYPSVDVAAHVSGQASEAYRRAMAEAATIWEAISSRLRPDVGLVATADHGHLDYPPDARDLIRDRRFDPVRFFGDPRSTFVSCPEVLARELAASTGANLVDPADFISWLGPGEPHDELEARLPDWVLMAAPGRLLLPRPFDKRLIGYHGGLETAEVEIPLFVR